MDLGCMMGKEVSLGTRGRIIAVSDLYFLKIDLMDSGE